MSNTPILKAKSPHLPVRSSNSYKSSRGILPIFEQKRKSPAWVEFAIWTLIFVEMMVWAYELVLSQPVGGFHAW